MISSSKNHAHIILTLVFLCISLSLLAPVMGWILILVVCAVVMRSALYLDLHKHAPSVRTLNLLALLSAIVLAYFSLQLGVLLGMINLLVLACSLKLMQLRSIKDYYQLITCCGFLIGCGFIFQNSIGFSLFYLVLTLLLLLSLACHISPSLGINKNLKRIAVMGVQALPIAVLLFIVLPKIGPLWQMPTSKSHQTGLAEKVTPGDIAQLSQSADLAFRVTFSGNIPLPQERYWRAIVMEEFDGKTWRVSPERKAIQRQYKQYNKEFKPVLSGRYFSYQIITEPTHQNWLYSIDIGVPDSPQSANQIWQSHEYQLTSNTALVSNFQYSLRSYPDAPLNQALYSVDHRINTQRPDSGNPETQRWVKNLRRQFPNDQEFINQVLAFFAEQPFEYTLQPPLMQSNPVDTFLFEQQQGFCSHYASAMAYILRLADIPARLVTGYQGGEMREQDYMSVYQYDAHAWIEAWHSDKGWQRYDPTAIVAPNRVTFGLKTAIEEAAELIDSPFSLDGFSSIAWLTDVRLFLQDIDFVWTKWILGFDKSAQKDLIKSLIGELTPKKLALFGLSVIGLIGLLLAFFFVPSLRGRKRDYISQYYQKSEKLLAKLHIYRPKSQGPLDFANSVERKLPNSLHQPFNQVTQIYMQHQYTKTTQQQASHNKALMKIQWLRLKKAVSRQLKH
ncbi:transglutaminase family protein [Aliiglaciecola aliphaticivorans]